MGKCSMNQTIAAVFPAVPLLIATVDSLAHGVLTVGVRWNIPGQSAERHTTKGTQGC
jgi:hypothetical protein